MVTQANSPMFSRKAFWAIAKSIEVTKLHILSYHLYIPSFGEWGFVLSSNMSLKNIDITPLKGLKYLINNQIWKRMMIFPPDIDRVEVEANRLSSHKLIKYYNDGWSRWYE
jgi:spermidine synthase